MVAAGTPAGLTPVLKALGLSGILDTLDALLAEAGRHPRARQVPRPARACRQAFAMTTPEPERGRADHPPPATTVAASPPAHRVVRRARIRGRPSGVKAAAHRFPTPCGPALPPELLARSDTTDLGEGGALLDEGGIQSALRAAAAGV